MAHTLIPGVSVSQVVRRYDVNTNLVFTWRRDPRSRPATVQEAEPSFLPVEVVASAVPERAVAESNRDRALQWSSGHTSLLRSDEIDCLCVVSGDGELAALATHFRAAGRTVVVIRR